MLWKHLEGNLSKVKVGRKRENSGSALETLSIICHPQREALLLSPSLLCSPHDRPLNWRRGVEAKNRTLFRKLAHREDGRLMSQNNHISRSGCQVLL